MPNAAADDRGFTREYGLLQGSVDGSLKLRASGPANIAEESLQHAQVGVPRRLQRDVLIGQRDGAGAAQLRVFTNEQKIFYPNHVLVESKPDWPGVVQRVIEQAHVEVVYTSLD